MYPSNHLKRLIILSNFEWTKIFLRTLHQLSFKREKRNECFYFFVNSLPLTVSLLRPLWFWIWASSWTMVPLSKRFRLWPKTVFQSYFQTLIGSPSTRSSHDCIFFFSWRMVSCSLKNTLIYFIFYFWTLIDEHGQGYFYILLHLKILKDYFSHLTGWRCTSINLVFYSTTRCYLFLSHNSGLTN